MSAPHGLTPELRERLAQTMCSVWRPGGHIRDGRAVECGCAACQLAIVDAIVAELVAAGWRDLHAVREAGEAQANHGRTG